LSGDRVPPIEQEPATVRVKAEVISLDAVAEREGLSVADQIALQDAEQRRAITGRMLQTFIAANTVTLVGVALLVVLDEINLWAKLAPAGDRIITQQVIIGLLAATTVQVGAITVIIARYLFPGRSSCPASSPAPAATSARPGGSAPRLGPAPQHRGPEAPPLRRGNGHHVGRLPRRGPTRNLGGADGNGRSPATVSSVWTALTALRPSVSRRAYTAAVQ
jgi:hypothetical protein